MRRVSGTRLTGMKTSFSASGFSKTTALALALSMTVTACADVATSTVTGSLLGAGLGAVIGHQSDRLVEGAVIGALVGGAIGYVVGKSRTERVTSAGETNRSNNYRSVAGVQVKQTDAAVSPATAHPGDDLDMNSTIALMAPSADQSVNVRQRIAIYKGDKLIGNIIEDNFTMTPGTHRITRRITLQRDIPRGEYTYVSHIKAVAGDDISETSSESSFTVS